MKMDYMASSKRNCYDAAFYGDLMSLQNHLKLDKNNTLNGLDKFGHTALHKAAMNGHVDCVKFLFREGATINIPDLAGLLPIHHAAANGHLQTIAFLVEDCGADFRTPTRKGRTPVQLAKRNRWIDVVNYFTHLNFTSCGTSIHDGETLNETADQPLPDEQINEVREEQDTEHTQMQPNPENGIPPLTYENT